MKVLHIAFFIFILSTSVFAQNKIAVVFSDAFEDEKIGIKNLSSVVDIVIKDFSETGMGLYDLQRSIDKLNDEIEGLKKAEKPTAEKELRIKQFIDLLEKFKKEREVAFEIALAKMTNPIRKKINQKLIEFVKQKGILILIDGSKDKKGSILWIDELAYITEEFIKFCNEEFEKEKLTNK
jgi:hypothetical protein